jgi:serine/threonine protein kinase
MIRDNMEKEITITYQVIEELGRGGMGRVYKVFDERIKEKVALKLLKPEIVADSRPSSGFRTSFASRARSLIAMSAGCSTWAKTGARVTSRWNTCRAKTSRASFG